jgi:hypothetical protein
MRKRNEEFVDHLIHCERRCLHAFSGVYGRKRMTSVLRTGEDFEGDYFLILQNIVSVDSCICVSFDN